MTDEEIFAKLEDDIEKFGVSFVWSNCKTGTFVYTIGLTDRKWPELILKGIPMSIALEILGVCCAYYDSIDRQPEHGEFNDEFTTTGSMFREVSIPELEEYMGQCIDRQLRVKGPMPRALQIMWPDKNGNFPGSPQIDLAIATLQEMFIEDNIIVN